MYISLNLSLWETSCELSNRLEINLAQQLLPTRESGRPPALAVQLRDNTGDRRKLVEFYFCNHNSLVVARFTVTFAACRNQRVTLGGMRRRN